MNETDDKWTSYRGYFYQVISTPSKELFFPMICNKEQDGVFLGPAFKKEGLADVAAIMRIDHLLKMN